MVTARSSRTPRTRTSAGLPHLLGLTLLLLGLLCAHGAGSHGGAHTTLTASAARTAATPATAAPADHHAPTHPVHDCAPPAPCAQSRPSSSRV
ncbi:hypothetical protein EF912_26760, partial [Streptomyces sp. WAC07061]|uniref:hypothetical protein n=1 Tax=Streptomyces sp. WAC07061 TaxID=2487410 RepID=UPI000FC1261D